MKGCFLPPAWDFLSPDWDFLLRVDSWGGGASTWRRDSGQDAYHSGGGRRSQPSVRLSIPPSLCPSVPRASNCPPSFWSLSRLRYWDQAGQINREDFFFFFRIREASGWGWGWRWWKVEVEVEVEGVDFLSAEANQKEQNVTSALTDWTAERAREREKNPDNISASTHVNSRGFFLQAAAKSKRKEEQKKNQKTTQNLILPIR